MAHAIYDEIFPHFLYLTIVEGVDPRQISPFAGISPSIFEASWAFQLICSLPTSVLEPAAETGVRHIRRITGAGYQGGPLSIDSLERQDIESDRPFCVLLSSNQTITDRLQAWIRRQKYKPLHIARNGAAGALRPNEVGLSQLQSFSLEVIDAVEKSEPSRGKSITELKAIVSQWRFNAPIALSRARKLHNCTEINNICLESAGYQFASAKKFTSDRTEEFVAAILESGEPIDDLRANAPVGEGIRVLSPVPEVLVFAPGMYRHLYERTFGSASGFDDQARRVFKALQRQEGYALEIPLRTEDETLASKEAKALLSVRRQELVAQTGALSVRAAGNLCTTLRLPLGTNRALGSLRQFASSARSSSSRSVTKLSSLFANVQQELSDRVPGALLKRLDEASFGVKLISDVPLEWLPLGDLPLCVKHEVSRIPATPGNLSIELLSYYQGIGLEPSAFNEVLHIDAAEEDDEIREPMRIAFETFENEWRGKIHVRHERVLSAERLVAVLNEFDGAFLVFDGHGSHDARTNVGKLHLGAEKVDVWPLKGRVRMPPIALLSACDAHALDRSHATIANGFLVLGAQSVIAPLLPIDARRAALFVSRFIYRLADYLPAALRGYGRALRWPEVVTGMTRLQLVAEIIDDLQRLVKMSEAAAISIMLEVNERINSSAKDWYEVLLTSLERETGYSTSKLRRLARASIASSDAIRYVHLGNPEHITVAPWSDIPLLQGSGPAVWPN